MSMTIRGADGRLYTVNAAQAVTASEVDTGPASTAVSAVVAENTDRLSGNDYFGTGI